MNLQESEPSARPAINSLACIHTSGRARLKTASTAPQRPSVPQHTHLCVHLGAPPQSHQICSDCNFLKDQKAESYKLISLSL